MKRILEINPMIFEFVKCFLLSIIAILLCLIYLKTPVPFTYKNLKTKTVVRQDIPLVRIMGGHVDVD